MAFYKNSKLNRQVIIYEPWSGQIPHPKNLTPREFQLKAVRFALSRNHAYLALDPGLGKTIVAALILNTLEAPGIYICPPSLKLNTENELKKWGVKRYKVIPDSILDDPLGFRYEYRKAVMKAGKDKGVLIIDEAHRFKNEKALRANAILGPNGWANFFNRVVLMSGTPMPNRPMELFPILDRFAADTIQFRSRFSYGMRYCAGYRNHFGYDFSGASRMDELSQSVKKSFMLRMKKKDVLKELPDKIESIVIIAENVPAKIGKVEREILKKYSPEDLMKNKLSSGDKELHLSTYRMELGKSKVSKSIKVIKDILDSTDESVLVFAEHTEVVNLLLVGLAAFQPLVITGATPMGARESVVKSFQTDSNRRVFIGNSKACGEGFTLTKATRVIHVEPSWTPAVNDQASDRAHRIGQTDSVYVMYLVYANSIDRTVMETVIKKRKSIEKL